MFKQFIFCVLFIFSLSSYADGLAPPLSSLPLPTTQAAVPASEIPGQESEIMQHMAHIDSVQFIESLQKAGISYERTEQGLDIIANQQLMLATLPTLQQLGALNSGLDIKEVNAHPITYSGAIALHFTNLIIPYVYKNNFAGDMKINIYLSSPDNFGNLQKHLLMSFNFNKDLYNKINWDNFVPQNLVKVAPNFTIDPWYQEQMNHE